eukprot:3792653-Alexandrium_andersonii.AAC.1
MLKMWDVDRCIKAADNLRKVMSGEWDLDAWNEAEAQFDKAREWRSFKDCENPGKMREAADYTDEWFRCGPVAFRAYY